MIDQLDDARAIDLAELPHNVDFLIQEFVDVIVPAALNELERILLLVLVLDFIDGPLSPSPNGVNVEILLRINDKLFGSQLRLRNPHQIIKIGNSIPLFENI